jgi:hypothetical protein
MEYLNPPMLMPFIAAMSFWALLKILHRLDQILAELQKGRS